MNYQQFLDELHESAEEDYRLFHQRLLHNPSVQVLGVRMPVLHKLAKQHLDELEAFFNFPDTYYEVTFVKLSMVSLLDWEQFIGYVERCVALLNNWATCDSFKAKCIKAHREEFIPYLQKFIAHGGEFYQRYALNTLLQFYIDETYFPFIEDCLKKVDTNQYYVHMAAAWMVAEILVKHWKEGLRLLNLHLIDRKTHNKAIQKANESYRLDRDQKDTLKNLKV
jgi:3-methyladenine DNA glycosylase AlkD